MNKKIADKAAKWWADKLRYGSDLDNGDKSLNGDFAAIMGLKLQLSSLSKLNEEQIQKFQDKLSEVILKGDVKILNVDYNPCGVLHDILQYAGIKSNIAILPWKTVMKIYEDKVIVGEGYGQPFVELD